MLAIAVAATLLSNQIVVGGKSPIEASILAILIGMVLRNSNAIPQRCFSGIKAFETPLIAGIVFIGASLNLSTFFSQGIAIIMTIVVTMVVGLCSIYALARGFRLPMRLAVLLALGTTICGGTAIAVTAPLIEAQEDETSYAIGTVALWGVLAIIFYPIIAQMLQVSDFTFGVFAGTAIHSTPQVVGAGFIFSELAGKTATAVKLVRNCFMVPAAFGIALWYARYHRPQAPGAVSVRQAFPWFLFGYFVMAGLNTAELLSPTVIKTCNNVGKLCILLGLAGIGLNTTFDVFRTTGVRPLLVGLIGSAIVATCSITMIMLFL